jgi:riboflavin transporter FmnP
VARKELTRQETPRETALVGLGLLGFCAGLIILLVALALGFHFESSPSADADTAKAQQIAVPAVVALVTGVVALAARRRAWAVTVAWVAAGAAIVAILLTILLPGAEY